jgi:hypothetical protein
LAITAGAAISAAARATAASPLAASRLASGFLGRAGALFGFEVRRSFLLRLLRGRGIAFRLRDDGGEQGLLGCGGGCGFATLRLSRLARGLNSGLLLWRGRLPRCFGRACRRDGGLLGRCGERKTHLLRRVHCLDLLGLLGGRRGSGRGGGVFLVIGRLRGLVGSRGGGLVGLGLLGGHGVLGSMHGRRAGAFGFRRCELRGLGCLGRRHHRGALLDQPLLYRLGFARCFGGFRLRLARRLCFGQREGVRLAQRHALAVVPQPRAFFAERREDGAAMFFEEALGKEPSILLGEGGEKQGGIARGGGAWGDAHESDGRVGR